MELEALDGVNNFELSPSGTVFSAISAEVGRIDNTSQRNIYYDGDSEVGVVITLHANEVTVNPKIHNLTTNTSIQIDSAKISGGIKAGDEIVISTVKGRKSATLLRNGATYNILSALGRDVQWFTLQHGDNGFSLSADQGLSTLEMVMSFRTRFEGV